MSPDGDPASPGNAPVIPIDDPRVISILSTEHWSLLSARSLAYNEAFARGGMFLSFLSASFVALALMSGGMGFNRDFLVVTTVVLAFDLVIGLTTYFRIAGANEDDLRTVHGMARIRHAYTEAAPIVTPYFTTPIHDDVTSLMSMYGSPSRSTVGTFMYGITTSGGMIGLIVSMLGGVFAAVIALIAGAGGGASVWIGIAGGVAAFVLLVAVTFGRVGRTQGTLPAMFPGPMPEEAAPTPDS